MEGNKVAEAIISMDIKSNRDAVRARVAELRQMLDRIESDINGNRRTTVSNSTIPSQLFFHLGRLESLLEVQKLIK